MTKTALSPLIGVFFRPGARFIMPLLAQGTQLILAPEPDNPYDTGAIKVLIDLASTFSLGSDSPTYDNDFLQSGLDPFGVSLDDIIDNEEPFFLGYIARQFPKKGLEANSPGDFVYNTEPGIADAKASLAFASNGHPLIKLEWA